MGYKLQEYEPYTITGKAGTVYEIPAIPNLSVDEIGMMVKFNETADPVEKTKVCKDFLTQLAPGLEDENIGDMEYFMIFEDYNKSGRIAKTGESSASRSSSKSTARR